MKKRYTILIALLVTASTFAQAPEKMSYQAVLRDATNTLLTNQAVGMQISILQTTITGTAVYIETQTATTNINGLVSLEIGTGSTSDNFATIDWSAGPYFIKTETDPTGGSSYTITGTSQIMSVPFALYAKTSGSSEANATNIANNTTGIETNTSAISAIETDQTTQNSAIALNTAKAVITAAQATAITANTAKVVITAAQATAITDNTAKVVITAAQATAISDNTAKEGITAAQASAITDNTAKVGITSPQASEITNNTDKVGITSDQASEITANTAKISFDSTSSLRLTNTDGTNTGDQDISGIATNATAISTIETEQTTQNTAITDNTDKVGITLDQASEITANTAKISFDSTSSLRLTNTDGTNTGDQDISGIATNTTAISTLQVIPSEGAFVDGDKTKLDGIAALIAALEAQVMALEAQIPTAAIGDFRVGGVVFWVDPTDNTHGLVCAIENQSAGIQWYNGSYSTTGATGTAIGTGSANTTAIIAYYGVVETDYAAGLARAYRGGGYTDWFLPSKDELNQMYLNQTMINSTATANSGSDFSDGNYWSSSESGNGYAFTHYFPSGSVGTITKDDTRSVRAVRAF
jgi:hypothetical protein